LNLFEFGFEFNRFPPVTGLTGPVNRYRRAAVRPVRSDFKTLGPRAIPRRSNTSGGARRWCRPPHSLFSLVALFVVLFGFMWIHAAKLIRPVDEGERWNQLAHGCAVDL